MTYFSFQRVIADGGVCQFADREKDPLYSPRMAILRKYTILVSFSTIPQHGIPLFVILMYFRAQD